MKKFKDFAKPKKIVEKAIKIFATIHHDHFKEGEVEEINRKLEADDKDSK